MSGVAVGRDGAGAVAAVASPSERVGTSVRGAQIELGSPATLADLLLALVDYLYYQLVVVYSTAVGALRMLAGGLGMMMTRATVLSAQVTGAEQQQQQQVHKEQEGLRKPVVGESQSQARAKAGAAPFADFGAIESPESLRCVAASPPASFLALPPLPPSQNPPLPPLPLFSRSSCSSFLTPYPHAG